MSTRPQIHTYTDTYPHTIVHVCACVCLCVAVVRACMCFRLIWWLQDIFHQLICTCLVAQHAIPLDCISLATPFGRIINTHFSVVMQFSKEAHTLFCPFGFIFSWTMVFAQCTWWWLDILSFLLSFFLSFFLSMTDAS